MERSAEPSWAIAPDAARNNSGIQTQAAREVYSGRWLSLSQKPFVDRLGRSGEWTFVERVAGKQAVAIIATTQESRSLVLIRQFRIPLDAWVWEVPAGLVDEGEALEIAAVRELKEETGFEGRILGISPPGVSSPGLSTEAINLVRMTCPETPGDHARESSEAIEVHLLHPAMVDRFIETIRSRNEAIDAKLLSYLLAISWCENK